MHLVITMQYNFHFPHNFLSHFFLSEADKKKKKKRKNPMIFVPEISHKIQ